MIQDVTSSANPAVKLLKSLHAKKHRVETGLFLAEGARLTTEAADQGYWPEILAFSSTAAERPAVAAIVDEALRRGARVIRTSETLLQTISKRDNAQSVIGAYRARLSSLDELPRNARRFVALEAVRDPGNLGTILRTADAAGAGGVILLEGGCDPFGVECVRASMGSIFAMPLVRVNLAQFEAWRRALRVHVVGTSLQAQARLAPPPDDRAVCLLMGNEQSGLPPAMERLCDERVRLPMAGKADSLNLAVATAIALYEVWRGQDYEGATR